MASYEFLWPIQGLFYMRGSSGFPYIWSNIFDENFTNFCFIWVPMANTMTFSHEGFPWVPIDFKVDLFYAQTNNYCFV